MSTILGQNVTYKVKEDEKNRKTEKARIQTQIDHALNNQDLVDRARERQQEYEQVDPIVDGSVETWHGKREVVSSSHYFVLPQTDAFTNYRNSWLADLPDISSLVLK